MPDGLKDIYSYNWQTQRLTHDYPAELRYISMDRLPRRDMKVAKSTAKHLRSLQLHSIDIMVSRPSTSQTYKLFV